MLHGIKEWLKVFTEKTKVKYCKAGQEREVLKEAESEMCLVQYISDKCAGVNTVTANLIGGNCQCDLEQKVAFQCV